MTRPAILVVDDEADSLEALSRELGGRYGAHYDVVAYNGETPNGPLSTFIISYGFTDLSVEDGNLIEEDCFCHAEHKANQDFVTTFPDAATRAILPRRPWRRTVHRCPARRTAP